MTKQPTGDLDLATVRADLERDRSFQHVERVGVFEVDVTAGGLLSARETAVHQRDVGLRLEDDDFHVVVRDDDLGLHDAPYAAVSWAAIEPPSSQTCSRLMASSLKSQTWSIRKRHDDPAAPPLTVGSMLRAAWSCQAWGDSGLLLPERRLEIRSA